MTQAGAKVILFPHAPLHPHGRARSCADWVGTGVAAQSPLGLLPKHWRGSDSRAFVSPAILTEGLVRGRRITLREVVGPRKSFRFGT